MPSFGCLCGRGIPLGRIPLRHGARLFRDSGWDEAIEAAAQAVVAYINALREGEQEKFIEPFADLLWPEASESAVIQYLLSHSLWQKGLEAFQCYCCGRIWIEDSLNPEQYRSFHPDGKWRGTFEVHAPGFLGCEAETAFYGCHLEGIERRGDNAIVTFTDMNERQVMVRFNGVVSLEENIGIDWYHPTGKGLRVMALGKWEAEPPCYRYVFDDYYFSDEPGYLAVVAQGFDFISTG